MSLWFPSSVNYCVRSLDGDLFSFRNTGTTVGVDEVEEWSVTLRHQGGSRGARVDA